MSYLINTQFVPRWFGRRQINDFYSVFVIVWSEVYVKQTFAKQYIKEDTFWHVYRFFKM